MAKTNGNVFDIGNGKFAIGFEGKHAKYVIQRHEKGYRGVRGRRPKLSTETHKLVSAPPKTVTAAFEAALA